MAIDLKLNKQITINATTAEVWDTLVNPDMIKEYLYGTKVISDWKLGSEILFTGSWEGKDYMDKGKIMKLLPEKCFQYSYWSGFSGLPDKPENYMIITFELENVGDHTILKLTQSNFNNKTQYEHSDKGWDASLDIIKKLLEQG